MHNLFLDGIEIMIKVGCPTKIKKKNLLRLVSKV